MNSTSTIRTIGLCVLSNSAHAHKIEVKGHSKNKPVCRKKEVAMSEKKRGGGGGGGGGRERDPAESTLHEVAEVYVYIPPEISAAGVELKLAGSVRVVNKVRRLH